MTEIMPVPRNLILLSYQQRAFVPPFFEILNLNKITMKLEHKKWGQKAQE